MQRWLTRPRRRDRPGSLLLLVNPFQDDKRAQVVLDHVAAEFTDRTLGLGDLCW